VEEDLLDGEGHLPVICLVHAVLPHHYAHDLDVPAAPETIEAVAWSWVYMYVLVSGASVQQRILKMHLEEIFTSGIFIKRTHLVH
jgi:hypothetical protein